MVSFSIFKGEEFKREGGGVYSFSSEILENELVKRKEYFPFLELTFKKKGIYGKFPHFSK